MIKLALEEYTRKAQGQLFTVTSVKDVGTLVLEAAEISTNMINMVGDLPSPVPQDVKGGNVLGVSSLFICLIGFPIVVISACVMCCRHPGQWHPRDHESQGGLQL